MKSDAQIKAALTLLAEKVRQAHEEAATVIGYKARITSDFNGQPYGRSHKPLYGKVVEIGSVTLYPDGTYSFCSFKPDWINAGFGPEDIEFL
jgi:hypothetical protein